jgi:hypothetical protein
MVLIRAFIESARKDSKKGEWELLMMCILGGY